MYNIICQICQILSSTTLALLLHLFFFHLSKHSNKKKKTILILMLEFVLFCHYPSIRNSCAIKLRYKYRCSLWDWTQQEWKICGYYTYFYLIIHQHRSLIFSIPLVRALRMLLRFFSLSRYDNKTFKLCWIAENEQHGMPLNEKEK